MIHTVGGASRLVPRKSPGTACQVESRTAWRPHLESFAMRVTPLTHETPKMKILTNVGIAVEAGW